eukprot:scaffold282588_cov46-Attheya_sp.AAC.1
MMLDADQDTAAEECADIFHADRNNAANRTEVDVAAGVVIQTTFQAHALGLASEEEKQDDKAKEKNENDARAGDDDGHVATSQLQPVAQPDRSSAQFGMLYPHIPAPPCMALYPPPLHLPLYMAQMPHQQPYQYRIPPPPPSPHVQPCRPISRKKRGRKKCLNPNCDDNECKGGYSNKYCEYNKKKNKGLK